MASGISSGDRDMDAPYGRMRNRQANQALFLAVNDEMCDTQ
jgi:hypothetical protein